MKAIKTGGVILMLIVGHAAGDSAGLGDFKTLAARNAAEAYSGTQQRLMRDYKEKLDVARKTCVNQLNIAQQSATKAGNLDEAIRIRDAVAKLNADAAEPAANAGRGGGLIAERDRLTQQLTNSVWQSGDAKLKFSDDGTGIYVGATNPPWSWVAVNGHEAYMRFTSGFTVRLTFDESLRSFAYLECSSGVRKEQQSGKRLDAR